jgi:hypothetical protein
MTWFLEKVGFRKKQSQMTPIVPPSEIPAKPEIPKNPLTDAVEEALKQGRRKVILVCEAAEQEKIIKYYQLQKEPCVVTSVNELKEKTPKDHLPHGTNTWIITDYSRHILEEDKNAELQIQSAVRGGMSQKKPWQLIVLTSTLPHEQFLGGHFPWFNGPFEIEDPVWSINKDGNSFVLTKHKIESFWNMEVPDQPVRESKWIEETSSRFEQ